MNSQRLRHAAIAAALVAGAAGAQAQTVLINEGFDSVAALAASGWTLTNLSTPVGSTAWYQGDGTIFASHEGSDDSYIAANYNNAAAGGTLSNWLISPTFSTETAVTVTFWARGANEAPYVDALAFGSGSGPAPTGYSLATPVITQGDWTKYTVNLAAGGVGSSSRFAIVYSGLADNANYVGVDSFSVTAVPEASTWAMMAGGLLALGAFARRRAQA